MRRLPLGLSLLTLICASSLIACGDDSPAGDASVARDAEARDFGPAPMCAAPEAPPRDCEPAPTDYVPGADDSWASCVSDDGVYHRIQESISSIQRVRAFESIAALLFDPSDPPSADDYLTARMLYQEEEGLDSRVARRFDPRFEVPEGTDCTQPGVPEAFPDYCVGPAILQPQILGGLNQGITTEYPLAAARVEGALLWFLYASTIKEAFSCTTTAKDCDSSYAYYTGGETDRGGIGLAGYVAEADPAAHERTWDGLLALRCWRDLDSEESATDFALRDRAREQLDRAVTTGFARVLRQRLDALCEASDGATAAYHWTFLQAAAPALYGTLGATDRRALEMELAKTDAATADVVTVAAAFDGYACP